MDFAHTLRRVIFLTPVTSIIWLAFILISALFLSYCHLSLLWTPVAAFFLLFLHEILAFFIFEQGIFPTSERIDRCYEWFNLFTPGCDNAEFKKIGDLTEGFYNGDYSKPLDKATSDKYDEIIKYLDLRPGHKVLDVGCGLGDFLAHLKTKNIEGVGLTVCKAQYELCIRRGLKARYFDFRNPLPKELIGAFDAVVFIGSLEHFPESYARKNTNRINKAFNNAFHSAYKALSPASQVKKVFSTTLHINSQFNWRLRDYIQTYIFHGHYSGQYPTEGLFEKICQPYFSAKLCYDASLDYQYTSTSNYNHAGRFYMKRGVKEYFLIFIWFLVNPFAMADWLYYFNKSWLWQFGGSKIVAVHLRPTKTLWYLYTINNSLDTSKAKVS
jgi:cyclopropane fatty-acyl-phospholipid synthase-like methyltransferase